MKILLYSIFWHDGQENSTRLRNIEFTWPQLQELCAYLRQNDIKCECLVYDFSPTQMIENSFHVPYKLGEFKKSEKLNLILKEQSPYYDYMCMFDCDVFFLQKEYPKLLDIFKNIKEREIYTFDLVKIGLSDEQLDNINITGDLDLDNLDFSYAYSGDKRNGPLSQGSSGGLGGVYFCDTKLLLENNGFNENIKTWGAEDGNMLDRIICSGKPYTLNPIRSTTPIHINHYTDWGNELYYNGSNLH